MANTTKNHFPLKARLAGMGFLEFAVWGSYLTSLGAYLAHIGMGSHIGWFYAVQGIVSIFMPGLVGIVADRWIQAQKVLSLCHLLAGAFMLGAGVYGLSAAEPSFSVLFALYTVSVAFFMPTIGLSNAVAYSALEGVGLDSVKHFPPIRVFGTIGFICAMLFVNFTGFQNTAMQMVCSGILSFVLCLYALTMPKCPVSKGGPLSREQGPGRQEPYAAPRSRRLQALQKSPHGRILHLQHASRRLAPDYQRLRKPIHSEFRASL